MTKDGFTEKTYVRDRNGVCQFCCAGRDEAHEADCSAITLGLSFGVDEDVYNPPVITRAELDANAAIKPSPVVVHGNPSSEESWFHALYTHGFAGTEIKWFGIDLAREPTAEDKRRLKDMIAELDIYKNVGCVPRGTEMQIPNVVAPPLGVGDPEDFSVGKAHFKTKIGRHFIGNDPSETFCPGTSMPKPEPSESDKAVHAAIGRISSGHGNRMGRSQWTNDDE